MRFPMVRRKAAEDEVAHWKSEADRQRKRADKAERDLRTSPFNRRQIAALYDEQEQVTRRTPAPKQDGFDEVQARRAADRIAELQAEVSRARGEARAEKKRADGLQTRLDDAVGLPAGGIRDSAPWQPGYVTPELDKETAS